MSKLIYGHWEPLLRCQECDKPSKNTIEMTGGVLESCCPNCGGARALWWPGRVVTEYDGEDYGLAMPLEISHIEWRDQ